MNKKVRALATLGITTLALLPGSVLAYPGPSRTRTMLPTPVSTNKTISTPSSALVTARPPVSVVTSSTPSPNPTSGRCVNNPSQLRSFAMNRVQLTSSLLQNAQKQVDFTTPIHDSIQATEPDHGGIMRDIFVQGRDVSSEEKRNEVEENLSNRLAPIIKQIEQETQQKADMLAQMVEAGLNQAPPTQANASGSTSFSRSVSPWRSTVNRSGNFKLQQHLGLFGSNVTVGKFSYQVTKNASSNVGSLSYSANYNNCATNASPTGEYSFRASSIHVDATYRVTYRFDVMSNYSNRYQGFSGSFLVGENFREERQVDGGQSLF